MAKTLPLSGWYEQQKEFERRVERIANTFPCWHLVGTPAPVRLEMSKKALAALAALQECLHKSYIETVSDDEILDWSYDG